jgi:NAD(P)-dependent dehydrogenase (short-subunit alcohol dehydrogenase family)
VAADAQRPFMVNATAPLLLVQALVPLMHQGGSIILNTSCLDGLGVPGMAVYSASKAAARSMARTLSAELKGRGIRVNAVAPGPTETPIYGKLGLSEDELSGMAAGIVGQLPIGRFAKPGEIAGAVAFLASDASSYVLGAELVVDSGWSQL